MGLQAGQAVLYLHPEIYLLHHGLFHTDVQSPQRLMTVNWVLLLGPVQEQGPADAVAPHGKGTVKALPLRRGSAYYRPACLTPALPIVYGQTQEPEGQQGWGRRSRGGNKGRWGEKCSKVGAARSKTTATTITIKTTTKQASWRQNKTGGNTGKQQQSRVEVLSRWD